MSNWSSLLKQYEIFSDSSSTPIIPLAMVKLQSRVPVAITMEDSTLLSYVNAAEKLIESVAEITLRQKVMNLNLSDWPYDGSDYSKIRVERPPLNSVVHIKYYDGDDAQQTLSSTLYEIWSETNPPIILIKNEDLPDLSPDRTKVIEIQMSLGNDIVVHPNAVLAILELCAFWFQNREAFGRIPTGSAQGMVFQSLIDSLRWRVYP